MSIELRPELLSGAQQALLDRLASKLIDHAKRLAAAGAHPSSTFAPVTNVYGLLGLRGAGKSTVLGAMRDSWMAIQDPASGDTARVARQLSRAGVRCVLPAVDCSVLLPEADPGAVVLMRIASDPTLKEELKRLDPQLLTELNELASVHTVTDRAFRDLCLDLASRPKDYQELALEGIRVRFELRERLARWLERATRKLGIKALLVLVDDFDLTTGDAVRRWIRALLDELQQVRLWVVLTADLRRLEHLSFEPTEGMDDLTGRSLIEKLMPVPNQVDLDRWKVEDRWAFRPHGRPEDDTLSRVWASALERAGLEPLRLLRTTLAPLVPSLPRGLLALHQTLRDGPPLDEGGAASTGGAVRWFLSVLARCRGEHLLARRLDDENLAEIGPGLQWARTPLAAEGWTTVAEVCRISPEQGPPVQALAPKSAKSSAVSARSRFQHDPHWGDPARHDAMWLEQFRDVQGDGRARWAELLLDYGFSADTRSRSGFVDRWPPARARVNTAHFKLAFTDGALERFFIDELAPFQNITPWMCWEPPKVPESVFVLTIGFTPLLNALREARDSWPAKLMDQLRVGHARDPARKGAGDRYVATINERLRLLPSRVRPLLLLVDALSRCPWAAYSSSGPQWEVLTHIRLAGELVGAAYVFAALFQASAESSGPGINQRVRDLPLTCHQRLLSQLLQREPTLGNRERDVLKLLDELQKHPLKALMESLMAGRPEDPLLEAARSYWSSPEWTSLAPFEEPPSGAPTR